MKNSSKQQGGGLIVFLAGSAVALIAIVVLLFVLNRDGGTSFKEPELVTRSQQTEILTPKDSGSIPSYPVDAPAVSGEVASSTQLATEYNLPSEQVYQDTMDVKPTAQQILDSGNLEKAKEVAKAEAVAKQQEHQQVIEHQTELSRQQTAESDNDNRPALKKKDTAQPLVQGVYVQAGAFLDKSTAEEQKAQLALMGVQTQIITVQADGKVMYRVQTGKLSASTAQQLQKTLQDNGMKTYIRQ